jgi:hypothetical protein
LKYIIILIATVFLSTETSAQTNFIPTGTWKYINGNDTIEIYLKPAQMMLSGISYPILIGYHKYVKNGQLIESSLPFSKSDFIDKKYTIIIYDVKAADERNDGDFKDISLDVKRLIILKKLSSTTMSVKLTSQQVRKYTNGLGYSLPRNFILTKE